MAKSISPEMLEQILTRVTDKFNDMFKSFVEQVVSAINTRIDHVESKYFDLNAQIAVMKTNIDDMVKNEPHGGPAETLRPAPYTGPATDATLQVLMAVEAEKSERIKRQRNVIVTGLAEVPGAADDVTFNKFCEEHLTVKPRPMSCRRLGRATGDKPRKLKVTLDSDTAAEDLISSSTILRAVSSTQRHVFFNRDLTPMEAQTAFEARRARKLTAVHADESTTSP
jgi:hypothetical protein